MRHFFNHARVYFQPIARGFVLCLLLLGGIALAQFTEPVGVPDSTTNSVAPINDEANLQIKHGGDLAADHVTATTEFCMGASCIRDWWKALDQPTTCKLEVKRLTGIPQNVAAPCDDLLYTGAKSAGWVSTGYDYCENMDESKCIDKPNNYTSCTYTRLVCTGAVTMQVASTSTYTTQNSSPTYPVTGAMTGDPYTFTRVPQCMDGINNGGSAAIDFPNDPNCYNFADNSELVF